MQIHFHRILPFKCDPKWIEPTNKYFDIVMEYRKLYFHRVSILQTSFKVGQIVQPLIVQNNKVFSELREKSKKELNVLATLNPFHMKTCHKTMKLFSYFSMT